MIDAQAMKSETTTPTERGQVSIPSSIRREMEMKPGQDLVWRKIAENELRVEIVRRKPARTAAAVIGCAKKLHEKRGWPVRTDEWLRTLRSGEPKA